MKWRVVKCFYIQMRQHLTFSIVSDGFGTFIRNFVREITPKKLNKDTIRMLIRKDGSTTTKDR